MSAILVRFVILEMEILLNFGEILKVTFTSTFTFIDIPELGTKLENGTYTGSFGW